MKLPIFFCGYCRRIPLDYNRQKIVDLFAHSFLLHPVERFDTACMIPIAEMGTSCSEVAILEHDPWRW